MHYHLCLLLQADLALRQSINVNFHFPVPDEILFIDPLAEIL